MHRDICEFISYARLQGLDVALATNGVLFDRKNWK